ncbi:UDP-glycosyltransferase 92a1 [Phtheirospermum japonicum]|uniref:Glycosyltransferase n=1 Tax=Phtheirospermum japonicum TaxID=374723 RepID=A0A830D7V8_9LAMI|nr:UDP-glycosyltransferase 92a1 [Phtheirospermum japonicum]
MLPFMAQGHLIPFLALANKIHRRFGFTITIATTPLNVAYLTAAINNNSSPPNIHLFSLDFNAADHGLPPNTENTEALPLAQIVNLFHSSTSLRLPFRALIRDISARDGAPPLCVISDVFTGWANEVAESCGTHNIAFTTSGAYGTAAYVSLWQHLPHRDGADSNGYFSIPGFPESCVFHVTQMHRFLRAADGTDSWSRFFQPQIAHSLGSFGWLCNTADEIEPFGLDVLRKYAKCPVWAVGPILPPRMLNNTSHSRLIGQHTGRVPGASAEKCLEWLDSHPQRSVLYISFGSQNSISPCQMMALAMGLEECKTPFVWVVRPPVGFDSRGEFKPEWLPHEFEKRTARENRGLVVHGWAPQLEILCHRSTGAFMSHCGWNSTVESLSQGVPIIGWPLAAEQGYNAKMLVEEMGVCVEITRGVDSEISREMVKEVVERVMGGGEKAEEMRKKASQIGELIRASLSEEGSSNKALDHFVSALLSKR